MDKNLHISAHHFQPLRLTIARELRGMTKSQLAELIGKTPSALTQFEGGQARPDAQTLKQLALALRMKLEFFASREPPSLIPLDVCHFRSLRSASQWQRRQLLAQGTLLCDLARWLEREVDLPPNAVDPVVRQATTDVQIEACADAVRRAWGLGAGPIPSMVRLLENKGVLVMRIERGVHEVDAFSFRRNGRPCVLLVMEKGSPSRARFDAAHELGHLVMHEDVVPGSPEIERAAHRFASAFLLPRESFINECPRRLNLDHFFELKLRWKVSVAAMVRRARDLGCLSEASYRRAFIQLRQLGTKERNEPPFERPRLLIESLEVLRDDWPLDRVAAALALHTADLVALLAPDDEERGRLGLPRPGGR